MSLETTVRQFGLLLAAITTLTSSAGCLGADCDDIYVPAVQLMVVDAEGELATPDSVSYTIDDDGPFVHCGPGGNFETCFPDFDDRIWLGRSRRGGFWVVTATLGERTASAAVHVEEDGCDPITEQMVVELPAP